MMDSIGNKIDIPNMKNEDAKKISVPVVMPVTPRNYIGRNTPCPCGSEKKYKKCCLNKREYTPGG